MSAPTVLLVEDNQRNLKLARDVLEFAGFTVDALTTGEEALGRGAGGAPDLILMDLQLPGIDGHTALARLRADPRTADIPVVALTASRWADRERALGAGFDGYLEKPISVREFPARSAATCRRRRCARWPDDATVLVVDDLPQNLKLMDAVLVAARLHGADRHRRGGGARR